jgi:hypothetical protein
MQTTSMTADVFPKARERMEDFVETFNRTSKQTIDQRGTPRKGRG